MKRRESDVLSSVLSLLRARGIFAVRMQTGALPNPRGRYVSFGIKGMADVLALPRRGRPTWIETKAPGLDQSPAQRVFQAIVESEGHWYVVIRSAAELNAWITETLGV